MRWLVLFLILSTGFSLCSTPYVNRFDTEFQVQVQESDTSVVVSVLSDPSISSRIEYGIVRRICKLDSSDVSKLIKISVGVQLGQKSYQQLLKTLGLSVSKKALTKAAATYFVSEAIIDMGVDALSPRAMSYQDILQVMRRSIEIGLADAKSKQNQMVCGELESAAKIYYTYSYSDYRRDVCGSGNLETVPSQAIRFVEKAMKSEPADVIISSALEFEEQGQLGSLAKLIFPEIDVDSKSDKKIMEEMIGYLKEHQSCSPGFDEQLELLESLVRKTDPGFFHAFLAVWSSMRSCDFHSNIEFDNTTLIFGYRDNHTVYGFLIEPFTDSDNSFVGLESNARYTLLANYSIQNSLAEIQSLSNFSGNITLAFESDNGWVEKEILLEPGKTTITEIPNSDGVLYFEPDKTSGNVWIWAGLALVTLFWFWRKDNETKNSNDSVV
ncbi:MAG: hypothetical protein GOU99_03785 [Candidatus Altiarchaeota archaeon]|nr:hypothetical protein [Candidatus Altiarchaeota archaeon]